MLATQLERAGFYVLRFDYSGTGDSAGASDAVTVETSIADIEMAADRLRQASGAPRIAIVGLRLGATLAMLASARGTLRPRHLLLWDPIVDGTAYLRELAAQHEAYMQEELGDAWIGHTAGRAEGTPTEALGAPISAALAAGLATIDLAEVSVDADECTVIVARSTPELVRLRPRLPQARWIEMLESTAWNSEAALNAMLVPMNIVQALVARIEETCP